LSGDCCCERPAQAGGTSRRIDPSRSGDPQLQDQGDDRRHAHGVA
jgi:hypothetical protein